MRSSDARHDLEVRAAQALKAVLQEISTVRVKEIRQESANSSGDCGLTAYVDVFGHRHTLACEIASDGQPGRLRSALAEMPARRRGDAMPVIIAPYLSPEAREICKQNKAGFLDLEGNASLAMGEVFILKQSLPYSNNRHRSTVRPEMPVSISTNAEKRPAVAVPHPVRAHRADA